MLSTRSNKWWLILLAGCTTTSSKPEPGDLTVAGGNSGSESTGAVSCPCGVDGEWAHVEVLSRDGDFVAVRVIEAIGATPVLKSGDEMTVPYAARLPCFRGVSDVEPGDDALALFSGSTTAQAPWVQVRLTHYDAKLLMAQVGEQQLTIPLAALGSLEAATCREDYGNWTDLAGWGNAPDGTTTNYWCVEPGREEPVVCGGAEQRD